MRIAYCINVRLPNERAHGHQVARVCDALSKLGHEVDIFAPHRRNNPVQVGFHEFHGVTPRVKITHLPSFDGIACKLTPGVLGLWMTTWSYRRKLRPRLMRENFDLLYTRTPEILSTLLAADIPVVLELHKLPRRRRKRFVEQCKKCAVVSCLTSPMREELLSWDVPAAKVVVEGDAVDLERFMEIRGEASPSLPHEKDKSIIGYVGALASMGMEKGIQELIDAVVVLKGRGAMVHCLIVGGPQSWVERYRVYAKQWGLTDADITFTGLVVASDVPRHMRSCDILVYPAPASRHPYFTRDTSPLKVFEYMAAERPIVTADLPPIRDVLDESTAEFFRPGDPEDLACAIMSVLRDPEKAKAKAAKARQRVEEHTWEKRMERIMKATMQRL